ncbi:MAG: TIR domain-containing protein [Acidovorax sp.]
MEKPALFIASSVEGLPVADAINVNLDHDVHCTIWRNGTFRLGSDGLGDLIKKSSAVDFAVFVFTPDDITTMRDKEVVVARDNVVFELGLFIGALGKDRCYVVKPRNVQMHLPSDVAGVTTADYVADRPDGDIASALNAACAQIKARIKEFGSLPRSPNTSARTPGQHIPNPPDYTLSRVDLEFLAQCVRSHVAFPNGLSYNWISSHIQSEDYRISLAAIKLGRLGYIEKAVEVDEAHEQYFAYRATDDGLDVFLKHEERYADLLEEATLARKQSTRYPPTPKSPQSASGGFEDMDKDIPF